MEQCTLFPLLSSISVRSTVYIQWVRHVLCPLQYSINNVSVMLKPQRCSVGPQTYMCCLHVTVLSMVPTQELSSGYVHRAMYSLVQYTTYARPSAVG